MKVLPLQVEECVVLKDRRSSTTSGARSEATTEFLSTAASSSEQDSGCEETPTTRPATSLCAHRPATESSQMLQDTADRLVGDLQRRIGDHLPLSLLKDIWNLPLQVQIAGLQAASNFAQADLVLQLEEEERRASVVAKLEQEVSSSLLASNSVDNHNPSKAQKDNAVTRARKAVAERMSGERGIESSHGVSDVQIAENDDFYGEMPFEEMQECNDSDMMEFSNTNFADPQLGYFMPYVYTTQMTDSSQLPSSEISPSEAWHDVNSPASYVVDGWYPTQEYGENGFDSMQELFSHLVSIAADHNSEAGTVAQGYWNHPEGMKGMSKRHWRQAKEKDFRMQFDNQGCKREITTLMIRNVPNICTTMFLMEALDSLGFQNKYDFIYLPMDNGSLRSIGYAFVNFMLPEVAQSCMDKLRNTDVLCQRCTQYKKLAWVTPAHLQGLRENLEHYKRTTVHFDIVEAGQPPNNSFRPIVIKGLPDSLADSIVAEFGTEYRQLLDDSAHEPGDHVAWSDSCSTVLEAAAVLEALTTASDAATTLGVGLELGTSSFLPPHRTPSRTPSPSPERYASQRHGHPGASSIPEQLPVKRTFIHYESTVEPVIADTCGDRVKQLCRSSSDPCILLHGDDFQVSCEEGQSCVDSHHFKESSDDAGKTTTKAHKQERWHERTTGRSCRNGYGGNKGKWLPKEKDGY